MTLVFGSLFSGIGGFDIGFERAGMRCIYQVEIDPFCQKVLAKHWPSVERHSDVRECGVHNLAPVDVICGGFPCQPFSSAGKMHGKDDARYLWPEFLRIIGELKPQWVVAENVRGAIGSILDTVLMDLEQLGYSWWAGVVPASALGAPHQRERVFVVAHTDRERLERGFGRTTAGLFTPDNVSAPPLWAHWPLDIPQPFTGRGDDGFPARVDRLRALGNAVVPQVTEWIGKRIVEADTRDHHA